MTMHHDNARTIAARSGVGAGLRRRVAELRAASERGAQAAEYAMLGGVSAAACGGLIWALRETDALERVVSTVVNVLTKTIASWF
ncbi:MAG TPA: hypothetical protein VML96_03605 [Egibacteraceae bacterium]|nr:hypothetical protein [Egibacteraceae bacterium]